MVELVRSEPGIPVLPADLDQDPMLLNLLNGTLDLHTGKLREHRREDLITKLAPVEYDEKATCQVWRHTLEKVFECDQEVIRFVQRFFGYCLTGEVSEQVLVIFWGAGANGKSTIVETMLRMLGEDYAVKASRDLFMAKKQDNHPTQMARLFGRRLVVCVETHEGARLDEGLVKELTGGDKITARRMREDPWQFDPTHKAILVTNHKPEIRGTDEGIWRRQRLVPFTVRFWNPDDPEERARGLPADLRQDKELSQKLKAELPGILAWCVEGCLAWKHEGLGMPKAVKAATSAYRVEQDLLSAFLEERCVLGRDFQVRFSELYAAYCCWCEQGNEEPVKKRQFGEALRERGHEGYTNNGTWYRGLALHARDDDSGGLPD
jgi:putative DNA primase/helicase